MRTVNKRVACSLFKEESIRVQVKNGVAVVKQKAELTKLTVIYDYSDSDVTYYSGDEVWVRGDTVKASEVYEIDGQAFTLVPRELVIAHKRNPPAPVKSFGISCSCHAPPEHSLLDK